MSAVVVTLVGDIDLANQQETTALLDDGVARARLAQTDLHVELSKVTFLGSTGISCLVQASLALGPTMSLHLVNPTPAARRILELCGLDHYVLDESGSDLSSAD